MKKIVLAASAALLLSAPGLGFAQDDHHHDVGSRPAGAPQGRPQSAPPSHAAGEPQGAPQFHAPTQGAQPFQGQHFSGGQLGGVYHPPVNSQASPSYRMQGPVLPGGQGGYRPENGVHGQVPGGQGGYRPEGGARDGATNYQGGYNRGFGAGQAPRAGGQAFGYGGRQFFRYRAAPYRYPGGYYGWANHSWRRGEWLPQVFIASDYFINDWYDFGLWQPDYGYEWIRIGADAVLVSLADGQVVDVVPGVYYY